MKKSYFKILISLVLLVIGTGCIDVLGTNTTAADKQVVEPLLAYEQLVDMNKLYGMPNAFIQQEIQKCWIQNGKASALSGRNDTELYVMYDLKTDEKGEVVMSNCLTLTEEEINEQSSSQSYRRGLPERLYKEQETWDKRSATLADDLNQIRRMTENRGGKGINWATEESLEYERKRQENVYLYFIEILKINIVIARTEKDIRGESAKIAGLKEIGKSDPLSEWQIIALQHYLNKYQNEKEILTKEWEQEKSKHFELPDQNAQEGGKYSSADIGMGGKLNRPGIGNPLQDPAKIKGRIDRTQLMFDYSVMKSDVGFVKPVNPFYEQPQTGDWPSWRNMTTKDLIEIDEEVKNPKQKSKPTLTREEAMAEWNRRTGQNQTGIDTK